MNVAWQQKRLLDFCRTNGIHVSAWSPLGANGASWGSYRVMTCQVLQNIATAKNKTLPQVLFLKSFSLGLYISRPDMVGMDFISKYIVATHALRLRCDGYMSKAQA